MSLGRTMTLKDLTDGGKAAMAEALAVLESSPDATQTIGLLDAAYAAPRGRVIGVTGPPGVGKSTLLGALIPRLRESGHTVGVIAVDPSSRQTGGALLGDRLRLMTDAEDSGVFVRSMAARDRLGGLAELTVGGMLLMRSVYDIVLIETVGVGQSETDVAWVADSVVFCVQPGSGDSLQFMKAGIMEIPDLAVVTKADSETAQRTQADLRAAMSHQRRRDGWAVPILPVSAQKGTGISPLIAALDRHADWLDEAGRLETRRLSNTKLWFREALSTRFGREGVKRAEMLGCRMNLDRGDSPYERLADLAAAIVD
jgi:LAO/AO transport system kinase